MKMTIAVKLPHVFIAVPLDVLGVTNFAD